MFDRTRTVDCRWAGWFKLNLLGQTPHLKVFVCLQRPQLINTSGLLLPFSSGESSASEGLVLMVDVIYFVCNTRKQILAAATVGIYLSHFASRCHFIRSSSICIKVQMGVVCCLLTSMLGTVWLSLIIIAAATFSLSLHSFSFSFFGGII